VPNLLRGYGTENIKYILEEFGSRNSLLQNAVNSNYRMEGSEKLTKQDS
jgi:hypothetical protein